MTEGLKKASTALSDAETAWDDEVEKMQDKIKELHESIVKEQKKLRYLKKGLGKTEASLEGHKQELAELFPAKNDARVDDFKSDAESGEEGHEDGDARGDDGSRGRTGSKSPQKRQKMTAQNGSPSSKQAKQTLAAKEFLTRHLQKYFKTHSFEGRLKWQSVLLPKMKEDGSWKKLVAGCANEKKFIKSLKTWPRLLERWHWT